MANTFDYAGLRDNTALPLITKFGQTITISRIQAEDYDPVTGSVDSNNTNFDVKGVLVDFMDSPRPFSMVEENDRKMIVESKTLTSRPEIGDLITLASGVQHKIKEVVPISPAGTDVIYICRVGK